MLIFGADKKMRGCYVEVSCNIAKGHGAYLSAGGSTMGGSSGVGGCFVSGITITQREKFAVLPCFNETNFVYVFGHDPNSSMVEVTFTSFIVNPDARSVGGTLQGMLGWYAGARVSSNPEKAILTIGSATLVGFVVGMQSGTADPHHNIQTFSVTLLVTRAQGGSGDASSGDGKGTVASDAGFAGGMAGTALGSSPGGKGIAKAAGSAGQNHPGAKPHSGKTGVHPGPKPHAGRKK